MSSDGRSWLKSSMWAPSRSTSSASVIRMLARLSLTQPIPVSFTGVPGRSTTYPVFSILAPTDRNACQPHSSPWSDPRKFPERHILPPCRERPQTSFQPLRLSGLLYLVAYLDFGLGFLRLI